MADEVAELDSPTVPSEGEDPVEIQRLST